MIPLALVSGVLGLILSAVLRRDTKKPRFWESTDGIVDERFVFVTIPGFSLLMLGVGGLGLVVPGIGAALGNFLGPLLALLCGLLCLSGLLLSLLGFTRAPLPKWLVPGWAKNRD